MSTRRARIKAVTSLPRRRKNAANVESKAAEEAFKDDYEKEAKSPKPANNKAEASHSGSPASKMRTPVRPRRTPVITSVEKASETVIKVPTPVAEKRSTPKQPERVPVITSTISIKSFFPSSSKNSPVSKNVLSPVQTPQTGIDINEKPLLGKEPTEANIINEPKNKDISKPGVLSKEDTPSENKEITDDKVIEKAEPSKNTQNLPEDFNVTNVPENVVDEPMDGIVPLQPAVARPKPIAVLKNEIISENAEVLFDPIVPLPSPSKVRPKLRPIPRLAPLRRNSIQGSASESEDESRRALLHMGGPSTPATVRQRHDSQASQSTLQSLPSREMSRIRNDSICSSASQATGSQVTATSPAKEKSKSRRQEMSRKMAAMRRRKETLKRDQLTMYDLIFYNPMSNPLVPNKEEIEAKEANEKETVEEIEADVESADESEPQDTAPVPQIKLGPNGEIMLDEQSLVIKQSQKRRVCGVVREGEWSGAGGAAGASRSYRRTKRTADWQPAETVRFYRALAAIGTDFSLMEPLFPGRNRRDLKLKFKKEEKLNCAQVDKAIRSRVEWDAIRLLDEFTEEREDEARKLQQKRDLLMKEKKEQQQRKSAAKELRVRHSRSAKTLGNSIMPPSTSQNVNVATTADEVIAQAVKERKRKRQNTDTVITPNPAPEAKVPIPVNTTPQTTPQLATLTLIKNTSNSQSPKRLPDAANTILTDSNDGPIIPPNVENGSLVVLTVNDPNSPSKKMLQTYIAHSSGKLKPIALNPTLLSSVFGYMKRGTAKSTSSARSSPLLTSPSSVASVDSKAPSTPGVIQFNPSPSKKSTYSITPL